MSQISSPASVMLKHCWQWDVPLFRFSSASASSSESASGALSKWKVNREAVFGPIPPASAKSVNQVLYRIGNRAHKALESESAQHAGEGRHFIFRKLA